jgi:hypothetical protein
LTSFSLVLKFITRKSGSKGFSTKREFTLSGFKVRRKARKFRLQILGLSILLVFCLAYLQYDRSAEIRLLSPDLTWENSGEDPGEEDLVMNPPDPLKETISASLLHVSDLETHSFKDSLRLPQQSFPHAPKISILRC